MSGIKPKRQGVTEYVRLASLPDKQIEDLLEWLPPGFLIKVEEGGSLQKDCVEYEDYEFWLEHCYKSSWDLFEEEI